VASRRIESLDYLRGLMAVSVMAYHYVGSAGALLTSGSVLGRLGIYAVAVFYVLSGLSLAVVYYGRIADGGDVADFVVRRVFRIFPLFYIAVTVALLYAALSSTVRGEVFEFPWRAAILNYTLSFGLIDPTAYLSTGAWSIGNEMVFYMIFPILLLLTRRFPVALPVAFVASLCVELGFAFQWLSRDEPIEQQWAVYINPFNQLFLFLSGVVIGAYFRPGQLAGRRIAPLLVGLGCVALFCLWPGSGNQISIATGWSRVALSTACVLFVACMFTVDPRFGARAGRVLAFLGEGCYSIYLLHPLVAMPVVFVLGHALPGLRGVA